MASLEDRAFGPDDDPSPSDDGACAPLPPAPAPAPALSSGGGGPWVAAAVLLLVVLYSLNKGIEYPELFRRHAPYRGGLMLANAVAIVAAVFYVAHGPVGWWTKNIP